MDDPKGNEQNDPEGMGGKVIVVNLAKRVSLSQAASGPGTVKRGRFANLQGGGAECRVCVRHI